MNRLAFASLALLFASGCNPYQRMELAPIDFSTEDASAIDNSPKISITRPAAGMVLIDKQVTVEALVEVRGGAVLSKVLLGVAKEGIRPGQLNAMSRVSSPSAVESRWEGALDLAAYPSQTLELTVVARDSFDREATALVSFRRDGGPVITVITPAVGTVVARTVSLQFRVDDAYGVDPNRVTAAVQSQPIPLRKSGDLFDGAVDFLADTFMGNATSGDQVIILTATNQNGTTAAKEVKVILDRDGPKITVEAPKPGSIVGGLLTITATVEDAYSEVAEGSVEARIPDIAQDGKMFDRVVPLKRQQLGMSVFSAVFDTRALDQSFVHNVITVGARDKFDNESKSPVQVTPDNSQPAVDMDPKAIRVAKEDAKLGLVCSRPFDPLGSEVANDGDILPKLAWLRALVEDRGNRGRGQAVVFFAGVDPNLVHLYLSRASDGPLAVDTNGDGVCDDVNPNLDVAAEINQPKQTILLPMIALPAGGAPDYTPDMGAPTYGGLCKLGDPEATKAPLLCPITGRTYTKSYGQDKDSSVWGLPPYDDKKGCSGLQFDFGNRIPDGPICAAVVVADKVGNRNVSRPLRLCVEKGLTKVCDRAIYRERSINPPFFVYTNPNQLFDPAKLPNCTGTATKDKMGKWQVDAQKPCRSGAKLNTGDVLDHFPAGELQVIQ